MHELLHKIRKLLKRRSNSSQLLKENAGAGKQSQVNHISQNTTGENPSQAPSATRANSSRIEQRPGYGLQTLYEPKDPATAIVDVVFIHGLTGSAFDTWLHAPSGKHWPSMMLKDNVPDARVLSFGYDADVANWLSQTSTNRISNHAENMLGAAVRLREKTQSENRKILFVAHSLGGLVTEKTIVLSRHSPFENMRQIERHTIGLIFLGTPHFGSDAAKWGTYVSRLVSLVRQTNVPIVEVLRPDSEMLASIQKEFQGLLRQRIEDRTPIDVTCFFEELPIRGYGLIVPQESAILHPYGGYGIRANHMDMTRFSSSRETGYDDIVGEILRPISRIRSMSQPLSSLQEECLRSLSFEALTTRQESIAPALAETYEWVWSTHLGFKKWLASGRGIYWVLGKPGSGKSTLIKYLAESPRATEALRGTLGLLRSVKPIVAAHFLDYKGQDPLARSMEGLLRSLLWQILRINSASFEQVLPEYRDKKLTRAGEVWSRQVLTNLLKRVLQHISNTPICIFIDALDEYLESDTGERQDKHIVIAEFFDDLAKSSPANIRFCLSGRPYPEFTTLFRDTPQLQLDRHTSGDVQLYVRQRFKPITQEPKLMPKQQKEAIDQIIDSIITKAEGVFLWVKLVCDALLRGWMKAESIQRLEQHLVEMPKKLSDLYQRIMDELDYSDCIEALSMLGIVASATRALSLAEFSYMLRNAYSSFSYLSTDDLTRRIRAICPGLLEIKIGKVRLCHETVFSYLRDHKVQALLDGNVHVLRACVATLSRIEKTGSGSIDSEETRYLKYSIHSWFKHAREARDYTGSLEPHAWHQLSNQQFLLWYELFLCTSWELPSVREALDCEFSIARLRQVILLYNANLSLMVCAPKSLETLPDPPPSLISEPSSASQEPNNSRGQFIMDTGSGISFLAPTSPTELLDQECLSCSLEAGGQPFSSLRTALDAITTSLAEEFLSRELHPAYLPDRVSPGRKSSRQEVLFPARHSEALKFLNKIEINNAWRGKGITPLQLAAFHGLFGILETLLSNGANVNLEAGTSFGTPLMASICGIAELLNPTFARSESVFHCFEMLLFKEADTNQAAFGTDIGGVKTPLDVSTCALLSRIGAIESLGNKVNVLEDIRCSNMIYVIDSLLGSGAHPSLEVQRAIKKSPQVWLLFEGKVSFIMEPGKKSADDSAVKPPRARQRIRLPIGSRQYRPRRNSVTGTSSDLATQLESPYSTSYSTTRQV